MAARVIVLNGGSSSGKSGIARCLQAVLPDPWLPFGTDTLVEALPVSVRTSGRESSSLRTARSSSGRSSACCERRLPGAGLVALSLAPAVASVSLAAHSESVFDTPFESALVQEALALGAGKQAVIRVQAAIPHCQNTENGAPYLMAAQGQCGLTVAPGVYPARAGGPWLCSTLVRSGFQAVVVPSLFRTSVQPQRWITTWW